MDAAPAPQPRLLQLRGLLDEFLDDAAARFEARQTGKPLGAVTGFDLLDRELSGALAPGLHIVHGSPGSGKTAFALQIAAQCQCPALYVTAEMAPVELLRRITARVTKTYLGKFKTGQFSPDQAMHLARRACDAVPYLALADATQAPARVETLYGYAQTTRKLDPDNPHLLLIIDSVHSWVRGWQGEADETPALIEGVKALQALAQRLNCAIVGIAERNRAGMKEGGMNAAAGTRTFEYGAESVIDLAAEKVDAAGFTPIKLTLSKNRHGAPGRSIPLFFKGATQTFTVDAADDSEEE
jgi:replicative DNA helicase